jgi:hypothetical protein
LSLRPPGGEYVSGGIVVAIMDRSAGRALPRSQVEWHLTEDMPARAACLAGRQPARQVVESATVTVTLFADDPDELRPTRITDGPRQSAVANHAGDIEVLDVDHLVIANQPQGLLVLKVSPGASYFAVRDSDLAPSLFSVFRPFLSTGSSPFQTAQLPQFSL